jgi:excisionase family DNA binding protein
VQTDQRLLTVAEVATALRVSNMTVYRLIRTGALPSTRVGRGYRIWEDAVDAYLSRATMAARGSA